MRIGLFILLNFILLQGAFAQAPVINSVSPASGTPLQSVVITGSGFNADKTKLSVWFDHVKGVIISSTSFSIEVQIPVQARYTNVEVINLATNLSGKSSVKFLPSYGGASFDEKKLSNAYSLTDPTELFDIASSDFDLDGKPDLAVTKTNNGAPATDILIYKNKSTGIGSVSFAKFDKTTLSALDFSAPTANLNCGDLNGDGKPDIVATRNGATRNEIFILRNTNTTIGTLSFAPVQKVVIDVGQFAFRVSIRDLNRDGKPELIVSNALDDGNAATDNQIFVFPNQSSGSAISFGSPIKLAAVGANTTYGLDVQDFDGDGLADIVVNQFQTSDLFIFKNQSTGNLTFAPVQKLTVPGSFNNVTSSDLNNDGLIDLVITATLDNNLQILINNSTPDKISFQTPKILPTSLGPWGVDISDIDGDGDADIIVANRNEAKVNVFRQDGVLSFTKLDIVPAATSPKPTRNLRVGDYDGDGKPDIALTSFSGLNFSIDVLRNANCYSPLITSPSLTICNGQTVRLSAKPALGINFDWKKAGTSVKSSTAEFFDATSVDSYTVTATGTFDTGCSITSPVFTLITNPGAPPTNPDITFNSPCVGGALNLGTSVSGATSYVWKGPNGTLPTTQNPTLSPVSAKDAGIYTLQITAAGCTSNIARQLIDIASVPVLPVTASPSATACAGTTVTLSVNANGYTLQWLNAGVAIASQTSPSLGVTQEGDYSVVVTSVSPVCNQETAKTTVKLLTAPVANFSVSAPTCKDVPINFTDLSTFDSRSTLNYAWNFGNTTTSTNKSPTVTYTTTGAFNVQQSVGYLGVSGCSNTVAKPITVSIPTVPTITASANPICQGETSTLSIAGSYTSIAWVGVSGSTSSVPITAPAKYTVNTTDVNGCASSAFINITAKPAYTPFVVVTDKPTIKVGEQAQLSATLGGDSYLWTPAEGLNNVNIANPIASPLVNTTYKVVAKKSGLCDAQGTIEIKVDTTSPDAPILPPALFSPNGDGINDKWIIPNVSNNSDCVMTIYDGQGSQIFQKKGYDSGPWDGTYNGSVVPAGVYYFVFNCPSANPTTGSVLVVK